VRYTNGSECDFAPDIRYETRASYFCDVNQEGIGFPVIEKEDECTFQIKWYSKFACPICNNSTDVDRIISSCNQKTGTRNVTYKLKKDA